MSEKKINNTNISFNKKHIKYVVPAIHFLLTFLWERALFRFSDNWNIWLSTAKKTYVSDTVELVLVYFFSKICAGIIIWLLWKLIFAVFEHKISKNVTRIFGTIYLIGLIEGLCSFPTIFGLEIDNYTIFSNAIRFLPTYWHSVYTGVVYAGAMMALPHPFSIFIFQWMAFVVVVAYIYSHIEQWKDGKIKYILLILFLLPESYYIVNNAYRNNFYTILCMFYFSYLIFSVKDKNINLKKIIIIAALSGAVMVWRSEGILLGIGGLLIIFVSFYKKRKEETIAGVLIGLAVFLLLNNFQKIGSEKYYGRDYMIFGTTTVLHSIFNDPDANLSYEGADDDLDAIAAIIPTDVLKEQSKEGYYNWNWTLGRHDFVQTRASDEVADEYMAAYYRIISHNIDDYLNVQTNYFYDCIRLDGDERVTYSYTGENRYDFLEHYDYYLCVIGYAELTGTYFTEEWRTNPARIFLYPIIIYIHSVWEELWTSSGIIAILNIGTIIVDIVILLYEIIKIFAEKEKRSLLYVILFTLVLGEILAIYLFMPEGRAVYLYPMMYSSYILIYYYVLGLTNDNEAETDPVDKEVQAES